MPCLTPNFLKILALVSTPSLPPVRPPISKKTRALLASGFAKLDLVSREEFDIQSQVLQRTREKLKALEARLDRLESPPDQPV
ncbi:MAG: accessory factor UbiK family protein [Candidatus Accumulibacter sp.]|uniref:Ubiquinone biosynthesis accessory factor UbiK n=1 Tax=Candidatus Accumulibacter affinis TaxID=2954384 RepID=A0A935W4B4_9PROT|nr:accessory factor UbiK family protein [Candidatus Accumulibacter affinis]